jgi:hypothetical protein
MPIAKALKAILPGHLSLGRSRFRYSQVIEAQICWYAWLVVSVKQWSGLGHMGPLSESGTPPLLIFRDRVELREIIGHQTSLWCVLVFAHGVRH